MPRRATTQDHPPLASRCRDAFAPVITMRGEAYVEQGRVLRIVNGDGDGVEATVRGSGRARYRVNVSAPEPGEPLVRFECDCPYAAELEPCKHMWAERAGGPQALLDRFMAAIGDSGADVIYTLDPRHGSYCHPSHRAVGALVVQAVVELGIPLERVHLLAGNTADVPGAFGFAPVSPGDGSLESYDATEPLASIGAEAWGYLIETIKAHPSQFPISDADLALVAGSPAELKRIFTVPLVTAEAHGASYEGVCAPSDF